MAAGAARADDAPPQVVDGLGTADLRAALAAGWDDFTALRSDVIFLVLFYPVTGLALAAIAFQADLLPLIFPLVSGFALLGPVFATGLYEMSRRRERGEDVGWGAAFGVLGAPALGAILAVGALLAALFVAWMGAALLLYNLTLGPGAPASAAAFLGDVTGTAAGLAMTVIGCAVGFLFAALVLGASVVSIPLLLDRPMGTAQALATSWEVTRRNPVTVALWGLIVAVTLLAGALPFFLGLVFALPLLGHATWHLYRRAVR
jgi:uncharacterized membrane protein